MGIGYKIGNGREWEHKKPFPVISTLNIRSDNGILASDHYLG